MRIATMQSPISGPRLNRKLRRTAAARTRQSGLTLIETAAALGIVALMLVSFGRLTAENQGATKSRATAVQTGQITSAAGQYLQANYSVVKQAIDAAGGATVYVPLAETDTGGTAGLDSLQKQGYLGTAFVNKNPYGQRAVLAVTRSKDPVTGAALPDKIEGMVLTYGGQEIPDSELGRIATSIGASGGFIPKSPPPGIPAGSILGAYGGWKSQPSNWNVPSVGQPAAGHIASTLAFQAGVGESDYLNRYDTGGLDNSMHTNIAMGGNSIVNAGDVGTNTVHAGSTVNTPTITAANGGPMVIDMNNQSVVGIKTIQGVVDATGLGQINMANQNVTVTQLSGTPNSATDPNTTLKIASTDVTTTGTVTSGLDMQVGRDLTVGVNKDASGNYIGGDVVLTKGKVVASKFVDADAKNYSIDPSGLTSLGALDPSLINADTYIYGKSVNRGPTKTNPKAVNCTGLSDADCDTLIQQTTDAYLQDVSRFDPTTAAGQSAIAAGGLQGIRLGDLLPSLVQRGVFVVDSNGNVTNGQPVAQPIAWSDTNGVAIAAPAETDPTNTAIHGSPVNFGEILIPTCGPGGTPEIYMSKLDDSNSFSLSTNPDGSPVIVVSSTPGGSATGAGGTYQGSGVFSQGWTTVNGTFQPVQTITTSPVVQEVKVGAGVNLSSTVLVGTSGADSRFWTVSVSKDGERQNGVNGSTLSVSRRVLAQTFCNYGKRYGNYAWSPGDTP